MRFLELLEARKKTNRRQVNQRLSYDYRGAPAAPEVKFRSGLPWPAVVAQHFYTLKINDSAKRRRIMQALHAYDRAHAYGKLQEMSPASLLHVVKEMDKRLMDPASLPSAHQRPGVTDYANLGRGPNVKITPDMQMRMNMVDVDVHKLSRAEMRHHSHPDVQKIARALNDQKDYHKRDKAVVYDLAERPFYLLIRPYKKAPGSVSPTSQGVINYQALVPEAINFTNKPIPETAASMFTKNTKKVTTIMRSNQRRFALKSYKTNNFQKAVVYFHYLAWKMAKPWFGVYKKQQQALLDIDKLEDKLEREDGLSHEENDDLAVLNATEEFYADVLRGVNPKLKLPEQKEDAAYRRLARSAKRRFTWYLWLLAAEDEYGIIHPDRRALYPAHPTTPREVKGKEHEWAIQPERKGGGEFRWDLDVLRGLGYGEGSWVKFIEDLRTSSYRLGASGGQDAEIQRLWIPMVGAIRSKHGLKLHPADITGYLNAASHAGKVYPEAKNVAGKTSGRFNVRKRMNTPLYTFWGGNQRRQFALISAAAYHQYFDSPYHGGERFIHGEAKLRQPVSRLTVTSKAKWGDKTKNLAQQYRELRGVSRGQDARIDRFKPRDNEQERIRADIQAADEIIKLRNKKFQSEKARIKRMRARAADPYQRWSRPPSRTVKPRKGKWVPQSNKAFGAAVSHQTKKRSSSYRELRGKETNLPKPGQQLAYKGRKHVVMRTTRKERERIVKRIGN